MHDLTRGLGLSGRRPAVHEDHVPEQRRRPAEQRSWVELLRADAVPAGAEWERITDLGFRPLLRGITVLDPGVLESSACSRVSTMTVEATVR